MTMKIARVTELEPWFLSPNDIARLCGLSSTEVREAIGRGELVARKYGRRWLVPTDEARRWIEAVTAA